MGRVAAVLEGARVIPGTRLGIDYQAGVATVTFPSERRQRVSIERVGEHYVFSSTAASPYEVRRFGESYVAELILRRNRESDLVVFMIDETGALIARIGHLASTLDDNELWLNLQLLAQEADRLEFLMTGDDIW